MFAAKSRPGKAEIGNSNAMMARYAPTVQLPDAWQGLSKNGYNAYGGNNVTNNDNSKSNATTIAMIALSAMPPSDSPLDSYLDSSHGLFPGLFPPPGRTEQLPV